jgi:hypothetical protein
MSYRRMRQRTLNKSAAVEVDGSRWVGLVSSGRGML